MVYSYLKNNYKEGEPVFLTDIQIDGMSEGNLRYHLKSLTDQGLINRFDSGIYYIPQKDLLNNPVKISAETVTIHKYINRHGKHIGYYSGYTLANRMGMSTQVPFKEEITSNYAAAPVREIKVGNRTYVIRRPVVPVTEENIHVLQLLDCLKDLEKSSEINLKECGKILTQYAKKHHITKEMIDKYIGHYPLKIFKAIYDTEVKYVPA
ncbi:MAG: DUF6088 family protein [Lachnospiraceae bacterium]|nr:DUF6088 family protein [Lachnospiraceae bacterium]